jgi:hypothetical protein
MIDLLGSDLGLLSNRAKKLNVVFAWLEAIDSDTKNKILEILKNDQLQKGIDGDGDIIGLYSIYTEMLKPNKVAGTPYTLEDTGAFYNSLFVTVSTDNLNIDGNGKKGEQNLFDKYTTAIVGLTQESKDKLAEILIPKYQNYVAKVLQIS